MTALYFVLYLNTGNIRFQFVGAIKAHIITYKLALHFTETAEAV